MQILLLLCLKTTILLILFPSSILWGNCLDQEETPWRGYRKKQVLRCLSWAKDQWETKQRYWTLNLIFNTYRRWPVPLKAKCTNTSQWFSVISYEFHLLVPLCCLSDMSSIYIKTNYQPFFPNIGNSVFLFFLILDVGYNPICLLFEHLLCDVSVCVCLFSLIPWSDPFSFFHCVTWLHSFYFSAVFHFDLFTWGNFIYLSPNLREFYF